MTNIDNLVRPNIISLKAYSSARDEYSGLSNTMLDANESPYGAFNRYPDPKQLEIRQLLAELNGLEINKICLGNGSDELIDLVIRIFCRPGKDNIIICPPTYGMYEVCAAINDVNIISIPLTREFQLDFDKILKNQAKVIFICSPNNPTGNCMNNLEQLISNFEGIVFVDEAYIDFSPDNSVIHLINKYNNLIVCRTFSKAFAMAGLRVGAVFSDPAIIDLFFKIKPPYNINQLSQNELLINLKNYDQFKIWVKLILKEKTRLTNYLSKCSFVKTIYPSDANFILVEFIDAHIMYNYLKAKGIIVRNRSNEVDNCLRITIGSEIQNDNLITAFKNYIV